jgi:glycosyltransferase involved in cell wall biosynthesis
MLKETLEIIIITYNRADSLTNTLNYLKESPFSSCRITVLNNCSTDDTIDVCSRAASDFTSFTLISNRVNIGGNPNYLKAIEISSSNYTWILCDDDYLDFSDCDDVVKAIESQIYDLIEVGAQEKGTWPRGCATTVSRMLAQGLDYHSRMTFFPAYIFRTELFDSACFCWGYANIHNLYPQFAFLNKSVNENFNIYLAKNKIIIRNEVCELSFLPLFWYAAWVTCCRTISDDKIRYKAIEQATMDKGFFKGLGFWTILDRKICDDGNFWGRVITILWALNLQQRLKYLLILPLAFMPIPLSFWVWVRSFLYKMMKVPQNDIIPLNFVNRGS